MAYGWALLPRLAGATVAVGIIVASRVTSGNPHGRQAVRARPGMGPKVAAAAPASPSSVDVVRSGPALVLEGALSSWARSQHAILAACLVSVSLSALAGAYPLLLAPASAAVVSLTLFWMSKEQRQLQSVMQQQARVVDTDTLAALSGMWVKDFKSSGSMERFFTLFKVPRLLRKAACLMRGMELRVEGDQLVLRQLCALPWFTVVEAYPLDGSPSLQRRRDMRAGPQWGRLVEAQEQQLVLEARWEEPHKGVATDVLRLEEGGGVVVHEAQVQVGDEEAGFTAVYRRHK